MRAAAPGLLGLMLLISRPAPAQDLHELRAAYQVYAAGLHVADVEVTFAIDSTQYNMQMTYHTTGLVSLFRHGHQFNEVVGTWDAGMPQPQEFQAVGVWNGENRQTLIQYHDGDPVILRLVPPQDRDREPVPVALQQNSVDSLSAIALLIRRVQQTGRCDAAVHTYDGHRASAISARTVGEEILPQTDRSPYGGEALRCDFTGQMLAGFLANGSAADRRPLHGSAWLTAVVAGGPPIPVRMAFQTRWFGEANMYLTHLEPLPRDAVAEH